MVYKFLLKPLLFFLPPESAHHLTVSALEFIMKIPGGKWVLQKLFTLHHVSLQKEVFGLSFPNPVGLAAGFDKDARHIAAMTAIGFGFIEVGTVTPLPQPGNERPRLFRLREDEALINRMGFNNQGVDVMAARLKPLRRDGIIVGGNIGKNKNTPNEEAVKDYETCFQKLFDHVDYFVVNVSSPNTPGLRSLQEKEPLSRLLTRLQELNHDHQFPKPILLKIAPDLSNSQLDEIIEIVLQTGLAGVIATNTTLSRANLKTATATADQIGAGGLSGKPLRERSTEIIKYIRAKAGDKFVIIGAGGIHSAKDAEEKLAAGADLVQLYTGMIYEGPGLMKSICRRLVKAARG
jgi:dihydroorotate dehydrogenase